MAPGLPSCDARHQSHRRADKEWPMPAKLRPLLLFRKLLIDLS
jgi:hypothetical protein